MFFVTLLSLELCLHLKKLTKDTLGYDWVCFVDVQLRFQNFNFIPRGQMRMEKRRFLFSVSLSLELHLNFQTRSQLILKDMIGACIEDLK